MRVEDVQTRMALVYASGTADRNGITIDTANFEWVKFVVTFAAIAASAVVAIKVQQGDASDLSDADDLEGTSQTVADDDDDQVFVIAITKPKKRYVRVVIDNDASHATAQSATVELGGARTRPALQSVTDEVTVEVHTSPDEGTA